MRPKNGRSARLARPCGAWSFTRSHGVSAPLCDQSTDAPDRSRRTPLGGSGAPTQTADDRSCGRKTRRLVRADPRQKVWLAQGRATRAARVRHPRRRGAARARALRRRTGVTELRGRLDARPAIRGRQRPRRSWLAWTPMRAVRPTPLEPASASPVRILRTRDCSTASRCHWTSDRATPRSAPSTAR